MTIEKNLPIIVIIQQLLSLNELNTIALKKIIPLICTAVCVALLNFSCKKSSSVSSDTSSQSAFFKASIGSQAFVATTGISGTYSSGNLELDGQQGSTGSDIILVKLFLTSFQPGQSGAVSTGTSGVVLVNGATQYTSKNCTVNITSSSLSYISGTFAFTSTDSTKVVGSFNEPYTGATPQGAFLLNEPLKRTGHIL